MKSRLLSILRIATAVAVLTAGGYTIAKGWGAVHAQALPRPGNFLIAIALSAVGSMGGAASWAALMGRRGVRDTRLISAYLLAQPAKYFPVGAAAQAVGLVALSASREQSRTFVAQCMILHFGIALTTALSIGAFALTIQKSLPLAATAAAVAGCIAWAAVLPRCSGAAVRFVAKVIPGFLNRRAPSGEAVSQSFLWALVPQVMAGISFQLLLPNQFDLGGIPFAAGAFSLAWAVGFIAIPFPSGLGVREAVLAFLIPQFALSEIILASTAHRLAMAVADLALFVTASALRQRSTKTLRGHQ